MQNILIYFPYNQRTVEQQSVMEMFVKNGHNVFLLTLNSENTLHKIATGLGVKCFSTNTGELISVKNLLTNAKYLVRFCKANKIDVIFAHQQLCALPLLLAKPFINCKAFYIRHNTDEGYAANPKKAKLLNWIVNRFSKQIIAPSNIVYGFLNTRENVAAKKLIRINYGYNFEQYEKPVAAEVENIRNQYNAALLVVSVARLVEVKRHIKMFTVIKQLVNSGVDCKFICLGNGSLKNDLEKWIADNRMEGHIFLLGIKTNVLDYLAAGDILLHLSETEASNSVVKEAGLVKKAAIVCKGVGDFEDYIAHNKNGFLVDKENPEVETAAILKAMSTNTSFLKETGENAYNNITTVFDINNVKEQYLSLLN